MHLAAAALLTLIAHEASATISLLTFPEPSCGGQFTNNIRSIPSDQFEASGCVATTGFESIQVVTADPGYVCNIYSDLACANFIATVSTVTACAPMDGNAVICFSQNKFDNPLDGATGQLVVSNRQVTSTKPSNDFVTAAVTHACGDAGCDSGNPLTAVQNPLTVSTTLTAFMYGNYDNTQQRDYMARVLSEAFTQAQSPPRDNPRAFLRGPHFTDLDNPTIWDIPTFGQVVLNDASGATIAEMSIEITSEEPEKSGPCESTAGKISEAAISAIPVVGAVGRLVFKVTCEFSA